MGAEGFGTARLVKPGYRAAGIFLSLIVSTIVAD
jgi:hypothetical protein